MMGQGNEPQPKPPQMRVNGKIRAERVEVLDESGKRVGEFTLNAALELAQREGIDLVEINGRKNPVVCALVDYGRFRYQCRNGRLPKKWII
jgi:translation initiation factor IF-3